MTYNLGINVVEVDGRATPSIQPAPTSVAGFIICAERGDPGVVYQVTNWRQFVKAFGGLTGDGFTAGAYGAYAVRGFFDNGGSLAYVTRIEPTTDTPAADTTTGTPPADTTTGTPPAGTTTATPAVDTTKATDSAIASVAQAALELFDTYHIQILCCPETANKSWVSAATTYCANRGDCMFVGHTPLGMDDSEVKTYVESTAGSGGGTSLRGDKIYGALYFPWIQVYDPLSTSKPIWVPPTGHILGVYARTERERGIWKAPAGNAARLKNALAVQYEITDTAHTVLVKDSSINAVRSIPGLGIVIDSSRSLSTNPLWLYVNIRLLFNFVESSLKAGLRWVVQEPNDETLWNKIKYNTVSPFLMGLWRRGAFGPGSPEEVFTVKVDGENNTPEDIKNGTLNVEVYFYPSRPAETIIIKVGQQEGGASVSES